VAKFLIIESPPSTPLPPANAPPLPPPLPPPNAPPLPLIGGVPTFYYYSSTSGDGCYY